MITESRITANMFDDINHVPKMINPIKEIMEHKMIVNIICSNRTCSFRGD